MIEMVTIAEGDGDCRRECRLWEVVIVEKSDDCGR